MNSIMDSHHYLLSFSIKPTVHRQATMNYLLKNRSHPTAEDIYQALKKDMPTLSRMTIYNSLELFVGCGAIKPLHIDKDNTRYDIEMNNHAHFVCKRCGEIHNIAGVASSTFTLPQCTDLEISSVEIMYTGVCRSCLTKSHFSSYIF